MKETFIEKFFKAAATQNARFIANPLQYPSFLAKEILDQRWDMSSNEELTIKDGREYLNDFINGLETTHKVGRLKGPIKESIKFREFLPRYITLRFKLSHHNRFYVEAYLGRMDLDESTFIGVYSMTEVVESLPRG